VAICPEEMEPDLPGEPDREQVEVWEKGGVKAAGEVQARLVSVSALPAERLVRIRRGFPVSR